MTDPVLPSVAVVTVSYHSGDYLPSLFASISTSTDVPVKSVVVNNAPDDSGVGAVVAELPGVELVNAGANLGYGKGMNLGVQHSGNADWLLLINPDLTLAPGALDTLLTVGQSDPSIGIVGPLIYTPSREVYPSARRLPSLRHGIGHAIFGQVWKTNPWTKGYLADRENPPRQRDAGWLSGSCLLVRRAAFDMVGGFDDKFFMYFEDVDLCARLARADWRVIYAPSAEITHVGGHSTQAINRRMIRVHHESAYKYLAARYKAWYLAPVRLALYVGLNIRSRFAKV